MALFERDWRTDLERVAIGIDDGDDRDDAGDEEALVCHGNARDVVGLGSARRCVIDVECSGLKVRVADEFVP